VFTDFNAMTPDEVCWNLIHQDVELEKQLRNLDLSAGDKVTSYQDEDDFDVVTTLEYRHVDSLAREALVAVPNWATINRKEQPVP
jgi:hypothetical protein